MFGNPGSTEVPLLDNLFNYPDIKYVLTLHESIAVAMADGYARASGKPGVASVHAAPGTSHSLGALYDARNDCVPVIVMAGQQDSRLLIREPFLSGDVVALAGPLTKWHWQVNRGEELPVALRRAFKEATAPPSGPVFLSLARNTLDEVVEVEEVDPQRYRVPQRIRGDSDEIRKAAEILVEARTPAIIAGFGVSRSQAVAELVKLAEIVGARVYAEPGTFPTDHAMYCGLPDLGTLPPAAASPDVLMVVGAKMFVEYSYSATPIVPSGTKAIHMDENIWEVAKNWPVDAAIVADPKSGLKELLYTVQGMLDKTALDRIDQRKAELAGSRAQRASTAGLAEDPGQGFVSGDRLGVDLQEVLGPDSIIVDQGLRGSGYLKKHFQFKGAGAYHAEKGGSLGWAIGAAMGAKLACPDKRVVALTGDGSAMYYPQALWTAAQQNIPITVVLCNNQGYMAVKKHMLMYEGEALRRRRFIGADIFGIDFVKMAESFGVAGVRVTEGSKLKSTLAEAVSAGRPMLVEVALDPNDTGFNLPPVAGT